MTLVRAIVDEVDGICGRGRRTWLPAAWQKR
jgi:hypothetical protein